MSRRRTGWRWPALFALAVAMGVPAIADAQLLPNLPTRKRQKAECCAEDPMYRMYRQQYYGYWPTCWRMWAPGWGCPSPAAPNSAQAVEEIREALSRQPEEEPAAEPTQPGPGTEMAPPPANQPPDAGLPALPRGERSPFNVDQPGARSGAAPGTLPVPGPNPNTAPLPEAPPANESGTAPRGPESADAGLPAQPSANPSPLTLLDMGDHPSSTTGPNPGVTAVLPTADDPQPLPAPVTPDPNAVGGMVPPPNMPLGMAPPPPPMQAPQRRGLLGGLFQNWGWRRR